MRIERVGSGAADKYGNAYRTVFLAAGMLSVKWLQRALDDAHVDHVIYRRSPHLGRVGSFRCRLSAYRGGECVTDEVMRRLAS